MAAGGVTAGRAAWVERLSQQDLPAMASVLSELEHVVEDKESTANQLADVLLKDASLTSQILKVANSVYYNPAATMPINTLSRAVVQLGTDKIKSICVSVLVIEKFLHGGCRERLLRLLASAFHTAVQAKHLFEQSGDDSVESEAVFIAGLLLDLGDMAFWSFGGDQTEALDELLKRGDRPARSCEREVLGTTLSDLSRGLTERWGLSNILHDALHQYSAPNEAVKALQMGKKIEQAIGCGWESDEYLQVTSDVAKYYKIKRKEARTLIEQAAEETAAVVLSHGAKQLSTLMPRKADASQTEIVAAKVDVQFQLDMLRKLGEMAQERVDLNSLFQVLLEGLHRGVGFERAAITLVSQDKKQLSAKYVMGSCSDHWRDRFVLPLGNKDSIFQQCLAARQLEVIDSDCKQKLSSDERTLLDNKGVAIIAPILAGQRLLGVYYADRGGEDLPLDSDRRQGFQQFTQQTNMCLALLASRNSKA